KKVRAMFRPGFAPPFAFSVRMSPPNAKRKEDFYRGAVRHKSSAKTAPRLIRVGKLIGLVVGERRIRQIHGGDVLKNAAPLAGDNDAGGAGTGDPRAACSRLAIDRAGGDDRAGPGLER